MKLLLLQKKAEKSFSSIHHRMPVVLSKEDVEIWFSSMYSCLLNSQMTCLNFYPVSKLTFREGYNGNECVKPIQIIK